MFSFWKNKKKPDESVKMSRENILAQAKASVAAARADIGIDTLEKIKEIMVKKQKEAQLTALKEQIKQADQDKVLDHLRDWMREKDH
jgi:hypothetical protein